MAESKVFEFPVETGASPDAVLGRAKERARGAGIVLHGDTSEGTFRGTAEGTYRVEGDVLKVEVRSKPAMVPWRMVENALRRMFG
jgi:hypothetical protein